LKLEDLLETLGFLAKRRGKPSQLRSAAYNLQVVGLTQPERDGCKKNQEIRTTF